MRSFIAATLLTAVAAETYTAWSTEVDTVISCGPEVTNCPGSSTGAWGYKPTTSVEVKTSSTSTCTDETSTGVWSHSSSTGVWTTSKSTSVPVTHYSTTETKSTETVHITSSTTVHSETLTKPTAPASWVKSSGVPYPSGSCSPGHEGWPGYTGGSTGWISKTAAATGTGSWAKPSATPSWGPEAAKGAASSVHAAGFLAGAGALLAFLL